MPRSFELPRLRAPHAYSYTLAALNASSMTSQALAGTTRRWSAYSLPRPLTMRRAPPGIEVANRSPTWHLACLVRQRANHSGNPIAATRDGSARAPTDPAHFIGVYRVMLELIAEADVVHVLEGLVLSGGSANGTATTVTGQRLSGSRHTGDHAGRITSHPSPNTHSHAPLSVVISWRATLARLAVPMPSTHPARCARPVLA
jgi:hypothetical protein